MVKMVNFMLCIFHHGLPDGLVVKNPPARVEDTG